MPQSNPVTAKNFKLRILLVLLLAIVGTASACYAQAKPDCSALPDAARLKSCCAGRGTPGICEERRHGKPGVGCGRQP